METDVGCSGVGSSSGLSWGHSRGGRLLTSWLQQDDLRWLHSPVWRLELTTSWASSLVTSYPQEGQPVLLPVGAVLKLEPENRSCQASGSPERKSHTWVPLVWAAPRANPGTREGEIDSTSWWGGGKSLPGARRQGWEELLWPACMCLVTQSCPTLCDPMDCTLPGSSVHGILQARILE